ncbi:MAG: hypothetical protein ABIC04_08755 [Nanoarchaeota archaeon]
MSIKSKERYVAYDSKDITMLYRGDFNNLNNEDKYLDLNNLSEIEYNGYKKVNLIPFSNFELKNDTLKSSLLLLRELFRYNTVERYLGRNNILKDDKILLYCYTGSTSKAFSYMLNKKGYNTYYTGLKNINKTNFLKLDIVEQKEVDRTIKTQRLTHFDPSMEYLFFLLGSEEVTNDEYHPLCEKINIFPIDTHLYQGFFSICDREPLNFSDKYNNKSLIICGSNLHCLLTKQYVYWLNKSEEISTIYKMD